MADCTKFHAPSDYGGSITCSQFDESQLELQVLCNEVNAISGGFTEEFLGLSSGDRVTLTNAVTTVASVYRNGLLVPSNQYSLSSQQVIFTVDVPFGSSTGGIGTEDIIVVYS